mgnify:FL=1
MSRLNSFREKLKNSSLDGFLVSQEANVSYLSRFSAHDSYLLFSKSKVYFITDFRYLEEARKSLKNIEVFQYKNLFKDVSALVKELKIKRLGFEARGLTYAEYAKIKDGLGEKTKFLDTFNIVESLRQIKSRDELKKIRAAVDIAVSAFRFIKGYLRPGLTEPEVAGELERFIRQKGAEAGSFKIIVSSGTNSCFPHAGITKRRLCKNDMVLVDMGAEINGYKSDLTRVFFLGKITAIQRKVYQIVREAQVKAIEAIRPGVAISVVDDIARAHIAGFGYGSFFGHSLGHGIGLEVHEEPSISNKNNAIIREGMVFTVEPGVYLPGKFGIRIEDMVLVTKKGFEVLSGVLDKSI